MNSQGLSNSQKLLKRCFDIVFSLILILLFSWVILISWIIATIDTKKNGFFIQKRVGENGELFPVMKIRSMKEIAGLTSTITAGNDSRITFFGRLFRKTKIDELPQLFNVLVGHMSFVGPRPDVPGYADQLTGEDRVILSIKPGITGPASIQYRREEELLAAAEDPKKYNDEVIWPDKVRINKEYIRSYRFMNDVKIIFKTVLG